MNLAEPIAGRRTPGRTTRAFVAVFLTAFIVCGFGAGELWPLTRWHLFSVARHPLQTGWLAVTVDSAGHEDPLPLGQLPLAYKGAPLLVGRFDKLTASEQTSLCASLVAGVRALGRDVSGLRIYRVVRNEAVRVGARAAPATLTLQYRCGGST